MTLLAIVGSSLEYGTTGRAARYFGAGRRDAAVNEGVQASWLGFTLGLLAVLIGEVIAGPVVRLVVGGAGPVADAAAEVGCALPSSAYPAYSWCWPATVGCAAFRTPAPRC